MSHPRRDDSASTYRSVGVRAAWRLGRAVAMLALAAGLAVGAHADRVDDELAAAQVLARDGKAEEAEAHFLDIIKANPGSVPALLAGGEFYEQTDRVEEALEIYAHVLASVDDANEAAERGLKRCFYRGRFPREIRLAYLKLAPVKFVGQRMHLSEEFHVGEDATETFAYTTSLMFPASLSGDGAAPWVRLPGSIGDANLMYNRAVYGLIADPGQQVLRTRWLVGYPSSTVLMSGGDYTDLAQQVAHLLVRGHVYLRRYLGIDRQPEKLEQFEAFLTEDGPTGAERLDDRVFFFDVDTARTPLELVREAFHELGHLLIPRVGPFNGDDRWANGDLGERLLFQWLAEEAAGTGEGGWPSAQAGEILSQLYGLDGQEVARYILLSCRLPINVWMATPPDDFGGDDGLERFAGFCLWVHGAHGRAFLAGMLQKPDATEPSAFVAAYKELAAEIIASGAPLRVNAGALNLMGSKLMQAPVEGALRRELIAIGAEGYATFRVYLPDGALSLSMECDRGAETVLSVHLDGASQFVGNLTGPVELGTLQAGWHEVRVGCASEGPVEIKSLSFFTTEPPAE